ncbi:alpha/beta-hydrolase [Lentithecium fluviatile CBS 122367]|uniref:Alpha/beta-hydrolase n=1 Tax=Lentithecium fluviatile CBS 122367 TaxID=1168545 RepID=A0A6G1ILW2_9PLEO|nr:alpha/beta-hydrolase [Lentithecium fluviatile CBS 122367]
MEDLPLPTDAKPRSLSSNKRTGRPDPFVIQPRAKHTHTAILLHGLGSGGEKFGVEFLESGVSSTGAGLADSLPGMKFVFPTAQKCRSAAFRRALINQWFNLASLEDPVERTDLQVNGLGESARYVRSILSQEMEIVPPQNIILGGLSQGCAMAIFILLSLEFPIGGFMGMSGWLPFEKDLGEIVRLGGTEDSETETGLVTFCDDEDEENHDAFLQAVGMARDVLSMEETNATSLTRNHTCLGTPIFLGHGEKDEKIKCKFGEGAAKTLASLGLDVAWKCYLELGHWYGVPDEIDDILGFLRDTLALGEINE